MKCYNARTFQVQTCHWQLYRHTMTKKFTAGSREWPSTAFYFAGSIMENSEPLPGSETTLI